MSCYQLESSLGYSVTKQNNIDLIEDDKLMFIVGNTIQILNISDNANNYGKFNKQHVVIHGHSNGIGAFAIHPNKKCFAFGEIGDVPDIYIYSYPELEEEKILSKGTQRKYSDMEFNANGNYLATIGGTPDHMLTIWDWKVGTVILRAKAFSQDVFNVRFSPYNQNRLITAGTGHIKFWEMAETFTGLKLQGKIGKFGEVDLSDVWSFVEFPSGKILSGSEHGNILMWQTDLIQFVIKPDHDTTCHNGNIIYVDIYKEDDGTMTLISAGTDGCIKFWECDNIEFFEASDDLPYYPLQIKHEIKVNTKCKLMSMIKYKNVYWIIQDAMGNLYKLCMDDDYTLCSVVQFHGLYVTSIECGNKSHDMITSGKDGSIRHWDLQTQTCDFLKHLKSSINLLLPLKINDDNKYFMVFCGDGVVRVIERGMDTFIIKYSLRIHDQPIIYGAISNNAKYLATITQKQLFFSHIVIDNDENITIQPIGFEILKHSLNKIYWSMDNNTLYSYCKQDIITYTRPTNEQFDTSSTFQIELNPTIIHFTPLLTEEDAKVEEQKTNNEQKEEKNEEKQPTQTDEKENKQEQKEKENIFDSLEWEISCILPFYKNDNDLLIAVKCVNNESFCIPNYYQWNISTNNINRFNATHFEHDYISNLSYSPSKQFLLISSQHNIIQICDTNDNEKYVNIRIHSNWQNTASLLSMSFDDRMLLSSSCDGSLFCHLFDPNKLKHPSFDKNFEIDYISLKDAETSEITNIYNKEDVIDMTLNDYSVQGEKIQRELDNAQSEAEKYKSELRKELNIIRNKKQEILNKTKEFIQHDLGLCISDLDIDTSLRTKMNQQLEKDKEQVAKEMAWNSEKIKLGLSKLENAFLKTVSVENIEVSSFRSNHTVSTFRTPILPNWVQTDIAKVHKIIDSESEKIRKNENININNNNGVMSPLSDNDKEANIESENKEEITNNKENKTPILSASKQKKMVREKLKNALEDLQNEKPDENTDDPRDIEAINFASNNVGDYKLKSDENYVVPENEHINASQKRKQMILLLESVNYIKMGLNERVLALRDLKKRIIENIATDTQRLNKINKELNINNNINPPTTNLLKEWPEQRYNYSKKDLVQFSQILQQELDDKSGNSNAFGGGGGAAKNNKNKKEENSNNNNENESENDGYMDRLKSIEISALEEKELVLREEKLEYEKRVLLDKINSTMHTFDMAVGELREEKYKLQNDLKLTDLKFLTLLKELSVLNGFEEGEIKLNGKLLKCRTEKAQVVVDLTETQEKLSQKLEEIRLWQEKDKKIMKEFDNIVGGERNSCYDDLKKIFARKIKRHKKNDGNDDNSESESDDSDFDSDSDSNSGDGDGDDSDCDDSCPKDCDNLMYEKVMELREKRLDQEEVLVEFSKCVNDLKQNNISLINREKNIDKNLFETEKEIELFQTEKQKHLNKIIISVPLLLSQIRINKNENKNDCGSLPNDIDNLLIFELKSLDDLKNRILQQKNEKIKIKKDYMELKKLHKLLNKKINIKQADIDIEKRKCEQVQFLKYGRLVPLEVLDLNANINPETVQLTTKLEKIKKEYKNKHNLWNNKLKKTKKELSELITTNTENIQILTKLKSNQNDLQQELNNILDIDVIKDSQPCDKKRNRELQKLVQVAKTQANEIDVLKAEIHMLQRKGGMLYALPHI